MKQNLSSNVLANSDLSEVSEFLDFLGPLMTLLSRGEIAYQRYMANGKAFLYAKILKENNVSIRQLIIKKSYLLPIDYQPYAVELLSHIDVWHALWEALADSRAYALSDEFVFDSEVAFPKASVEVLRALYISAKNTRAKNTRHRNTGARNTVPEIPASRVSDL